MRGPNPTGERPAVKIGGELYLLAQTGANPAYATATTALESVPSDTWEIVVRDFSDGIGGNALAAAVRLMCSEPGRVFPSPVLSVFSLNDGTNVVTSPPRYSFEATDENGRPYLYLVSPQEIAKIDLGTTTPTLRRIYKVGVTWPLAHGDRFGRPILSGGRWYFPCNNGERIVYIANPVAVDNGVTSNADTFTQVTSVLGGASHFRQLPSGRVVRTLSSHTSASPQNRAMVSVLAAGADLSVDANWGQDFPVGNPAHYPIDVLSFDELILVRKSDDRWYVGVEEETGDITWRDLLPDETSAPIMTLGNEPNHSGVVWGGELYLPTTREIWRHTLATARPVSINAIRDTVWEGDIPRAESARGAIPGALLAAGAWLYCTYYFQTESAVHVMAARRPRQGEDAPAGLVWLPVFASQAEAMSPNAQLLHFVRQGAAAPRLLWTHLPGGSTTYRAYHIQIDASGAPFAPSGLYTQTLVSGTLYTRDFLFPARAMVREARLVIEDAQSAVSWELSAQWDRGPFVILGSRTTTGSIFPTPGTGDSGRRLRLRETVNVGAGSASSSTPPTQRELRVQGYYLPDVGDTVTMAIDVDETARQRRVSQEKVRTELSSYRGTRQPFVDPHGAAGHILITRAEGQMAAVAGGAGAVGQEVITLTGEIVEYA